MKSRLGGNSQLCLPLSPVLAWKACAVAHSQVDLNCGSGRSCAPFYFLGEVSSESAGDGEKPVLCSWVAIKSVLPYSWSRISRMSCQFVHWWLSSNSRCVCMLGSMWDHLEEVQEYLDCGGNDWVPGRFKPFSTSGSYMHQIAVICWRSLF